MVLEEPWSLSNRYRKKVDCLVVTPSMIKCFHECTAKSDYKKLFLDYPKFFASLKEKVWEVNFEDPLPSTIVGQFSFFCDFMYRWEPNTPCLDKETMSADHCKFKFFPHLCLAMQTKNWDDFYEKYLPTIDFLIEEARRQRIITLKIEFGSEWYDTFSLRDKAANQLKQEQKVEDDPQNHRVSAFCSSGHSSPFDCNSNCVRFLRSLYGSKRGRRQIGESVPTKPKSSKHVTFAEPNTEKSEDDVILDIPKGPVASRVAEVKEIIRVKDPAAEHEIHTEMDKKSEGVITEIPMKLVTSSVPEVKESGQSRAKEAKQSGLSSSPQVKQTVPTAITEVKEIGSARVSEVKESVPSRVTEVKKTIPARTAEVEKVEPISVPEVKKIEQVKTAEVKQTVPTEVTDGKELVPNKTPEVKQTLPTEKPKVYDFGSTSVSEVRKTVPAATQNPTVFGSTRFFEVKAAPKVSSRPKPEDLLVNQQEDFNRLEFRIQKLIEKELDLTRIESDKKVKNLENRIHYLEENLTTVEINQRSFDQKLQQIESRFESSMEMKLKEFGEKLTSTISQNKTEDPSKKIELLEEKLQYRELILHQKIDEIKIREQTLDNRMNELMEVMGRKMCNSEEMKIRDQTQEDIDFDRQLAEQLLEERLRRIQKKRKEMNENS